MAANTPSYRLIPDGENRTPLTGWRVFSFQGGETGERMSVVAKRLEEQQAEFISLYELLESIVQHDGCTLQQAAQFLMASLDFESGSYSPPWHQPSPRLHLAPPTDAAGGRWLLQYVAKNGDYSEEIPF